MWLYVPSVSAPASAGSILDSSALERLAQSVTSNGKHSLPRVWSRRCKQGGWLKLLSGVTCEPSTLERGVAAWISSLADTPASHSAPQADDSAQPILDTSGLKSCGSTASQEPDTCSARTSLDTSALASKKSSRILPAWGRMLNGVCSKRPTLELPIRGKGCSSWPTATAMDSRSSGAAGYSTESGRHSGTTLTDKAKMWSTPKSTRTPELPETLFARKARHRQAMFDGTGPRYGGTMNLDTQAAMWPTPDAAVSNDGEQPETFQARREAVKAKGVNGNGMGTPLAMAAKMWPTPITGDAHLSSTPQAAARRLAEGKSTLSRVSAMWATPTVQDSANTAGPSQLHRNSLPLNAQASLLAPTTAKAGPSGSQKAVLNPAFVEALMGFPIGWTDLGASATPSSPK